MPGGVVRGFDVITGELRWAFDPGQPEDKSAPADGQTYAGSTRNVWAPMSYDAQSNTVFMPVGSQGTPISYKSTVDGKRYIVISAGGARNSPDSGDYVIAYALPGKISAPR